MTEQEKQSLRKQIEELQFNLDQIEIFCNSTKHLIHTLQEKLLDDDERALTLIGWQYV